MDARHGQKRNSGLKFFSLFLGLSHPVLVINNARIKFFSFLNFFPILFYFFNFLAWVGQEQNSGIKFFSAFLGQSHPVLPKNNAAKRFFNFLNIFAFSFWNFLARVECEWNSALKFFCPLSQPISSRFVQKLRQNDVFQFFEFFSYFFLKRSPAQVGTEFGTKFLFSLSRPLSTRFGQK